MGDQIMGRYTVHNEIVAEALTQENYKYWFECVRNYLIARDIWDVVDGTFSKPPQDDENHKQDFVNWRKMNAAALHVILISCGTQAFSHISDVSEAYIAWNILNHTYKYNPPESQPTLPVPEMLQSQPQVMQAEEVVDNYDVEVLYKAICDNKWESAKAFIEEHPSALWAKITSYDQTPLHVAVFHEHVNIVENLVRMGPPSYLEIPDTSGLTPLATDATFNGNIQVAEYMVNKNSNILGIQSAYNKSIPVGIAFDCGHIELGRYLYSLTPLEFLKPDQGPQGSRLLHHCFIQGQLDIALDLLQRCEELIFAKDNYGWGPIMAIARMPLAFSNGSQLVFWKRWIYNYINIQSTTRTNSVRLNIQQQVGSNRVEGPGLLHRFITNAYNMLGLKEIYELKLLHAEAGEILRVIRKKVRYLGSNMKEERLEVGNALYRATAEGNVEFVVEISKANPQLILMLSSSTGLYWNTLFYAVAYRQPQVFNLIHALRFRDVLKSQHDVYGNTLLHVAANLAPSSQLNRLSGPAFQMQSELQWFKEVESIVPQGYRLHQNNNGMLPKDAFKENHKELRKEGEKWMKETASSCSVVGALVVTIMFATAFTVPGGNNQDFGYPIFLEKKLFMVFVISDALSLFSSTTSVLMFLGILTSRYAEEDFFKSLPTKLIIGLSTLFLSIATMMIAFSATILLMLKHRSHSWVYLPLIILASVPITLFVLLQFPLLVRMVYSTYGSGIFKRNIKSWL